MAHIRSRGRPTYVADLGDANAIARGYPSWGFKIARPAWRSSHDCGYRCLSRSSFRERVEGR